MTENDIATEIVDACFKVHTNLGPGLLESVYETVLAYELEKRGLKTTRQQSIPVVLNFELEREILGFGENIKVLSPRFLVKKISRRIESANLV